MGRVSGRRPGRLRTEREQRAGQAAEGVGFGTCRGERKASAARGFDDTGGDFQETKTQRCELSSGQFSGFGNSVAHSQHQPISGGVENEIERNARAVLEARRRHLRSFVPGRFLGLAHPKPNFFTWRTHNPLI
jgi:hypothetical protein